MRARVAGWWAAIRQTLDGHEGVAIAATVVALVGSILVGTAGSTSAGLHVLAAERVSEHGPTVASSPTSRPTAARVPEPSTTTSPTTIAPPTTVVTPPPVDADQPAVVARPIPVAPAELPPSAPAPPWASSTRTTSAGYTTTSVGCATGSGAGAIDAFFAERVGPLVGTDYQHVYPLGGDRYLWLFQDAFVDHAGSAVRLDQSRFAHNVALVQDGTCFTLYHRGSAARPASFEPGYGESPLTRWFWPMGGELSAGRLQVFWVEMHKDPYEPDPGDGLGWHPARTWLATYDASTLARLSFDPAPNDDVLPVFGYAVSSDATYTYLFGNTFEQNLVREGGFWSGPHSATSMWLARVPLGRLDASPEYRTDAGWSADRAAARPIVRRYWVENPMQPRYFDGQWVAATKVDGYWGEQLAIDVAPEPWGPWTTVEQRAVSPRRGDPAMNTYHAHLLPWRAADGSLIVTISQNARDMARDAYPQPWRYRLAARALPWHPVPTPPSPASTTTTGAATTTATTIVPPSTSGAPTTTTPGTTTTTTTVATTTTTATTTTATTTTATTTPTTCVRCSPPSPTRRPGTLAPCTRSTPTA